MNRKQSKNKIVYFFSLIILVSTILTFSACRVNNENNIISAYHPPVSLNERNAILDSLEKVIIKRYVFKNKAIDIVAGINKLKSNNFFKEEEAPSLLAKRLSQQLLNISNDKHLILFHDSTLVKRLKYEQRIGKTWNARENFEVVNDYYKSFEKRNYQFQKAEILTGNVGYLKFDNFAPLDEAKNTINATMQFFAKSDALIIDLRTNGGGHVNTADWVASHFLEDNQTLFYRNIPERDTIEYYSYAPARPQNLLKIPLYILVSEKTASAAEILANSLQEYGRAKIMGETTWGGAHACSFTILNDRFAVLMPMSEILGPKSLTNWEATGVEPDIKKSNNYIIDNAHHLAIADLQSKASNEFDKKRYLNIIKLIESKFNGAKSKYQLKDYVGTFGHFEFFLQDDELMFLTNGTRPIPLFPVDKDLFVVNNYNLDQIQFSRNIWNKVDELQILKTKGGILNHRKN